MIAVAAFTSVNGSIIVGARSNYALGRDWSLFEFLGRWDEASGSPRTAVLMQGVIALALVAFGAFYNTGFKGLVEYSLPVFWGFFMLVGIALFILRVGRRSAAGRFACRSIRSFRQFLCSCARICFTRASLIIARMHWLAWPCWRFGAVVMLDLHARRGWQGGVGRVSSRSMGRRNGQNRNRNAATTRLYRRGAYQAQPDGADRLCWSAMKIACRAT